MRLFWSLAWVGGVTALACQPALESRSGGQAADPGVLSVRASVTFPEEPGSAGVEGLAPPTEDLERIARHSVFDWFTFTLAVDPGRVGRARSDLPLDRVPVDRWGAQAVHLILEGPVQLRPDIQVPFRRSGVRLWDEPGDPDPRGPVADLVIERADPIARTTAIDSLWADGVLEISVLCHEDGTDGALRNGLVIGEALERWHLRPVARSSNEWRWDRTYEGTVDGPGGPIAVRAEIHAVDLVGRATEEALPEGQPSDRDLEERRAAAQAAAERAVAAHEPEVRRALAEALATRELVVVLSGLEASTMLSVEAREGALLPGRDQVVVVHGGDPGLAARNLAQVPRGGQTLWVAGTDGPRDPLITLQVLGSLLAPLDPARAPRLDDVRWELAQAPYLLHEIPAPEAR